MKRLLLIGALAIGCCLGANPFVNKIDTTWDVEQDDTFWAADRMADNGLWAEVLCYEKVPRLESEYDSIEELLEEALEDIPNVTIHFSSDSKALISWVETCSCSDCGPDISWVECGAAYATFENDTFEFGNYFFIGENLTQSHLDDWMEIFKQELNIQ